MTSTSFTQDRWPSRLSHEVDGVKVLDSMRKGGRTIQAFRIPGVWPKGSNNGRMTW